MSDIKGLEKNRKNRVDLTFKIDWLSFTIESEKDLDFELLGNLGYRFEDFEPIAGKNFFNSGFGLNGYLKIFFNDPNLPLQRGYSLLHDYVFTGVGCSDLSQKIDGNWIKLFKMLKKVGVKFRRIDVALDDFNNPPLIDFPLIERKLKKQEFKSSKRHYNVLRDVSTSGELTGETVYLGSRKTGTVGHTVLRIYQKYLQMVGKHQESQLPIQALKSKSWIRWELEITKQKSIAMIDLILDKNSVAEAYYAVLRDTIDFLVPTKNRSGQIYQNKSKWKSCNWWIDFLNGAKKSKLQDPKRTYDIASALDWVRFSVMPTLQMLDSVCKSKNVDFYSLLQAIKPMELSKKQQKVIYESSEMSEAVLGSYLADFVQGVRNNEDEE